MHETKNQLSKHETRFHKAISKIK